MPEQTVVVATGAVTTAIEVWGKNIPASVMLAGCQGGRKREGGVELTARPIVRVAVTVGARCRQVHAKEMASLTKSERSPLSLFATCRAAMAVGTQFGLLTVSVAGTREVMTLQRWRGSVHHA